MEQTSADLRLVKAVLLGNDEAVEALIVRLLCVPLILSQRNFRLGSFLSADDLTDLTQDTLALVWQKLEEFEGRSSLETWVYAFCMHQMMNAIRSKRRRPQTAGDDVLDIAEQEVSDGPERTLEYEHVYTSLARLDQNQAQVIKLKHFSALTFEEIAKHLRMSPSTAKTLYYRGLDRLRGLLGPEWRGDFA